MYVYMYIFCIYVVQDLRTGGNSNYQYCSSKRVNIKSV